MSGAYESKDGDRDKFDKVESKYEDKFEVFENWLLMSGSKFNKLELRDYGEEVRGCHTTTKINEDEIIIEIPLKCLITVEMGQDTDIGRAILTSNIELDAPKHIFLMIFMLIDRKNPKSFFKPYYDVLPPTLSNMPIFWTAEELKYLEGSYVLHQIHERNEAIETDYNAICDIAPHFSSIATLTEFKWARMCVCSRNFGLIVNGIRTAALVPYADMLNHYRPRETKWQFDNRLQSFTIVSMQPIMTGLQVYDSYGQKCNHRFLLNYGFSVENNVEPDGFCPNEVPILLQLKEEDPLYDFKCSYFRKEHFLPSKRLRVCIGDNEAWHTLHCFLRIIECDHADTQQLTSNDRSSRNNKDLHTPLNINNEIRAMTLLQNLCAQYLAQYPSSYEEDTERLESDAVAPFSNERHALIQVKGEKKVLLFYKDFAESVIRVLQAEDSTTYRQEVMNVQERSHHLVYTHIRNTVPKLRQAANEAK